MSVVLETQRLTLRPVEPRDAPGLFAMDSHPEVNRFLDDPVPKCVEDSLRVVEMIQKQYQELGVGRLAVELRESGEFLGWSGLKRVLTTHNGHQDYYDLGYRFLRSHWGKGYATESARASLDYGFETLGLSVIYGETELGNTASQNVLTKVGLRFVNEFQDGSHKGRWYMLKREEWDRARRQLLT